VAAGAAGAGEKIWIGIVVGVVVMWWKMESGLANNFWKLESDAIDAKCQACA